MGQIASQENMDGIQSRLRRPSASSSQKSSSNNEESNSMSQVLPMSTVIPRKRFTVVAQVLPECNKCHERVEKLDLVKDGKEQVFHKTCLKCTVCSTLLARRECVSFRQNLKLTRDQFVEMDNAYYCDKHSPEEDTRRKTSIKAQNIAEKYVSECELQELGFARKESNVYAKRVLENSGAFTNELTCGRCGTSIELQHRMTIGGMIKYHEICPSKEGIERSNKSLKFFLKRLPERLAVTLLWDRNGSSHTFLYLLDREAWKQAYTRGGNTCFVHYFPDPDAVDPYVRRFTKPETLDQFDVQVKHYPAVFGNENTKTRDISTPQVSEDGTLHVQKHTLANGVHQSLLATFIYQFSNVDNPIQSEYVCLTFEKDVYDVDPLAALKAGDGGGRKATVIRQGETPPLVPSHPPSSTKLRTLTTPSPPSPAVEEENETTLFEMEELVEIENLNTPSPSAAQSEPNSTRTPSKSPPPRRRLTGMAEAATLQARKAIFENKSEKGL